MFIDKFLILNIEDKENDVHKAVKTHQGTVLVLLNNPSHLRKLKDPYTMGAQKWFPAKIISRNDNGSSREPPALRWQVQYATGQTETLGISDIKRVCGSRRVEITDPETLVEFESVSAKKSDELRMNPSTFELMDQQFGQKQVHLGPNHLFQQHYPSAKPKSLGTFELRSFQATI